MFRPPRLRLLVLSLWASVPAAQLAACGDDSGASIVDGDAGLDASAVDGAADATTGADSTTSSDATTAADGDASVAPDSTALDATIEDAALEDVGVVDAAADGPIDGAVDAEGGTGPNGCETIDAAAFANCSDAGAPQWTALSPCSATDFGDSYGVSLIQDVGACGLVVARSTALVRVNPDTGARTCLGSLPCAPMSLVRSRDRSLLALCASSILAIDLGQGTYRDLSSGSTPNARSGLTEYPNGNLLFSSGPTSNTKPTIYEVDRCTGTRSILSTNTPDAGVGAGSGLTYYDRLPLELAPGVALDVLVYGMGQGMRVDSVSGDRTVFSTACGTNGFLDAPNDVVRSTTDAVLGVYRYTQWNLANGTTGTLCSDLRSITTAGTVSSVSGWTGSRSAPVLVGQGTQFIYPVDVTKRADGRVFVVDSSLSAVVQVEVANGNRVVVGEAATSRGTGWAFADPSFVELGSDGMLYVADFLAHQHSGHKAIFRVDPATGNRTLVTSNLLPTGTPFFNLYGDVVTGLAGPSAGKLALRIENTGATSYMDVTVATGARATGSSATFRDPKRVGVGGTFYAIVGTSVVRETDAGNVVVASGAVGSGTPIIVPAGIARLPDDTLVVADTRTNLLVKIDPNSGVRTILSGVANL